MNTYFSFFFKESFYTLCGFNSSYFIKINYLLFYNVEKLLFYLQQNN